MSRLSSSHRIRELFDLLADASQEERSRLLHAAELDPQKQAMLVAMLDADRQRDAIIDIPAAELIQQIDCELFDPSPMIGRYIGPYRVVELIGHGGSSLVFRATRTTGEMEQTVALKLLSSRWLSRDSRRRFGREQYILSQLEHPNVARFLDCGVSDAGVPYLCLEYIEGLNLMRYAQEHALGRDERLRLLEQLGRAVDAAHRLLIVHRDLKPSNVLVTAEGCIKVLDFGTAKLLEGDDGFTQTRAIELTPGYAAPEQYRTGPVTTAADVYALGVLASELLIGVRLGPDAAWPEDMRIDAATRARRRELDPDLQRMLRAALAGDPTLRYRSAGYFADDILRFLRKEPLFIHPPSTRYRMRKFVARNRAAVLAAAVAVLVLSTSLGVAVWQARVATHQARQAMIELQRANAMRDFMFAAFGETERNVPHPKPATLLEVVERAIEETRNDRALSPAVRTEMLTRLGGIVENQGDLDRSRDLLAWNAAAAAQTLGPEDPLTLDAERSLADILFLRGDFAEARERLDGLFARTKSAREDVRIRILSLSADLATKEHDLGRARKEGSEALERARKLGDADVLRLVLEDYGNVLLSIGDTTGSLVVYEELLRVARTRFGERHAVVAGVHASLARVYRRIGDLDAAERAVREALAIDRDVHPVDDWRTALHLNALMALLKERRAYGEALEAELESTRIDRVTLGDSHPDTLTGLNNIGVLHVLMEDYAAAKTPLREALDGTVKRFGEEHWQTAFVRVNYGYVLARTGELEAGDAEMEHACATFTRGADPDFDSCATAREKQVRLFLDLGLNARAMRMVDRLDDALREIGDPDYYWTGRAATLRGAALLAQGRDREAVDTLDQVRRVLERSDKTDAVVVIENLLLLAQAERHTGAHDRSRSHAAKGQQLLRDLPYPPKRLLRISAELADN